MKHDELLEEVNKYCEAIVSGQVWTTDIFIKALRAVVELHEPAIVIYPKEMQILMCMECGDEEGLRYPCPTIQAIEKELSV